MQERGLKTGPCGTVNISGEVEEMAIQQLRNELRHTAEFPHLKGAAEGVLHDVFRQRQVVDFTLAVNNIDVARDELIARRSDRSRDSGFLYRLPIPYLTIIDK